MTLLRAIARCCGIHIWEEQERARISRNPHEERLHLYMEAAWDSEPVPGSFFSADRFRSFSQSVDEWAIEDPAVLEIYGGKSLLVQSHGQSHMSFFRAPFPAPRGCTSWTSRRTRLPRRARSHWRRELEGFSQRRGGPVHHRHPLADPAVRCPGPGSWSFDGDALRPVAYADTEHYRLYKAFFAVGWRARRRAARPPCPAAP